MVKYAKTFLFLTTRQIDSWTARQLDRSTDRLLDRQLDRQLFH